MNHKAFQVKAITIIAIFFFSSLQHVVKIAGYRQNPELSQEYAQILNSTVQIRIFTLLNKEEGKKLSSSEVQSLIQQGSGYVQGRGLGTIIHKDGIRLILTHNHWGEILLEADLVEIRNFRNELLVAMTGVDFLSLVRFWNKGTLMLEAPANLNVPPARHGSTNLVKIGQPVLLVHQSSSNPDQVEVVRASVRGIELYGELGTWTIKTSREDAVKPGDSGGGVWANGELIGNLWTTKGFTIQSLWGHEEKMIFSGTSQAAQLPNDDWSGFISRDANKSEVPVSQEEVKGAS